MGIVNIYLVVHPEEHIDRNHDVERNATREMMYHSCLAYCHPSCRELAVNENVGEKSLLVE